jgi:mannose-6-phosphate isomerase-like protein (cupin superfamily)
MKKVNISEKIGAINEYWSPHIVGSLNGQHVKLARIKGEFVWHHHADADEMFFILKGRLILRMHDGDVVLDPGEFFIVPKGVEHLPVAEEEVHLMLFEPHSTLNTGNVQNERTIDSLPWI